MIPLNFPFLPPEAEYQKLISSAWSTRTITNNGPLVRELEEKLRIFFGVKHLFLVSSGTIGLEIAIKALNKSGDIITSPFSYVAAPAAIVANNSRPVYVDIDGGSLEMKHAELENAINEKTVAIFPTHLYGSACEIEFYKNLAAKYSIPLVWDAAHSFGTTYKGKQIAASGDISVLSFHAYKIFHTIEGGAIITSNDEYAERIYEFRYFGIDRKNEFVSWGKNAKMNEFQAAMGLLNLEHYPKLLEHKKHIREEYIKLMNGSQIQFPRIPKDCEPNNSYTAVLFENENKLQNAVSALTKNEIQSRRYFSPSLNELKLEGNSNSKMPNSESVASRILCLPCYYGMSPAEVKKVCDTLLKSQTE